VSVQKYVIVQPLFAFLLFVLHLIYMPALRFLPNADKKMLNQSRFLHFYISSTSYFPRIYLVLTMKLYPNLHFVLLLPEFLSKSNDVAKCSGDVTNRRIHAVHQLSSVNGVWESMLVLPKKEGGLLVMSYSGPPN